MTTVVNCRKTRSFDVNIMRPGKWGNPYRAVWNYDTRSAIDTEHTRDQVLKLYWDYLRADIGLIKQARQELRNKVLGCCCKPAICHGDILAAVVNASWKDVRRWIKSHHLPIPLE